MVAIELMCMIYEFEFQISKLICQSHGAVGSAALSHSWLGYWALRKLRDAAKVLSSSLSVTIVFFDNLNFALDCPFPTSFIIEEPTDFRSVEENSFTS